MKQEANVLVELKEVVKTYKNKNALNGINFVINEGDRIGIIGANGSGKSTMSEIIAGIRKPTSGEVIKKPNIIIGSQFQESKYPIGISVMDMIQYYLQTFNISMKQIELFELLKKYQIFSIRNKFIEGLSGGQQQRLNILLSLIHNPDLVILDEVSTGLDIEVRSEIFEQIQEQVVKKNKTMILVTHMMSEIEEFCEKFIYVHNGEIKDAGLVKDLIKKHGSVHAYTWNKFKTEKSKDLQDQYDNELNAEIEKKPTNKFDKIIGAKKNMGKNMPLIKLMLKYYYKGFFVPFFLLFFPILLLFLEGFAFKNTGGQKQIHNLVGSIAIMQAISVGIFTIPQTILEFKNSVLMKRIGSTNIKPIIFVLAVVFVGLVFMVAGSLWTLLWGGIFFGSDYGWSNIALPKQILVSIPYVLLIFALSISLGMMLSSVFRSTTAYIAFANVVYMPVAFLTGMFIPIDLIMSSDVLKYVTYLNPFKYAADPFLKAWEGNFKMDVEFGIYAGVSIALICLMGGIASWKLRWQV